MYSSERTHFMHFFWKFSSLFKGGVTVFEFSTANIWWFLSVRHLKRMKPPNFERFLKWYSPWKKIPKFLAKNKLCGQKRDMKEIRNISFCSLLFLSHVKVPTTGFFDILKNGPGIYCSIFELSQCAQASKVDIFCWNLVYKSSLASAIEP